MQDYMKERFEEILKAAAICDQEGLDMPVLVLLYSLVDALAWTVYGEQIGKVSVRFETFCNEFLLPTSGLACTAKELYSARCASLHLLGWESDLTKNKGVRALFYSHRDADLTVAQRAADAIAPGKFFGIHAIKLHFALKLAIDRVIDKSLNDKDLEDRLKRAGLSQYRSMSAEESEKHFRMFREP